MAYKIQIRRDTATNWTSVNPTLGQGELGYETTTGKLKVGDGAKTWTQLDYLIGENDGSIDLGAVDKHVLPATDNVYDLGSPTKQWRELYVSGGSIYVGDIKISNQAGRLIFTQVTNPGQINEAQVPGGSEAFELPVASDTLLGAVKIGDNLTITEDGTLNAQQGDYELPTASNVVKGGILVGDNLTIDGEGYLSATVPDVSNFITAEAIPFVPTDVADLTDTTNLLGSGTTVPSVDIESTAYKGFIARYGRVYDNGSTDELTVSKIVIFRESAYIGSGSTIDPTSSNDTFAVTGLGPSDVVAMFVLYGETNGAKSLETLTQFVEVAVDTVLLDGGVEGEDNTIEAMRAAFYANINTLTAAAGGLVADFDFYQNYINATTGVTTVRQGSGAAFVISSGLETYTIDNITNGGTNYLVGHKIKILGGLLGGVDVTNDAIITVTEVNAGAITAAIIDGLAVDLVLEIGISGTNYQAGSGFVVAGVGKNEDTTLYANTNSQGTGYVVGDVLTLPGSDLQGGASPDNDITITVTGVGNLGEIGNWDVTGTFPDVWPTNSIDDGGEDQYDTGNYINTNLANEISYNGGEIVEDAELQFGPGSKYVVTYDSSVFGIFATGSSATTIRTSGNSGADGDSTTDTGALQSAGVNQQNAVIELAIIQGGLTFPDGTEQTTAFSRVKSTATGGRRIEEVAGYKQVAVTEVTRGQVLTATIRDTRTSWDFYVDATETLNLLFNDQQSFSYFEFSFDDEATWIPVTFGGGQFEVYYQMTYEDNIDRTVTQGDIVKYRVVTGGGSVEWWDKDDLPGGATDFRGAIIDYHAYTSEATIIGTIHIVDDDGEENITHTEVSSGGTDSENDDLWLVQNEGTISYRRIDGESKTLKVHWTAKVFYGNETYD